METEGIQKSRRGRPSLAELLATLDEEVRLLATSLGGHPRAVEADQILREIWIDDVHNSTAIEGNTLTKAQVRAVVERGRAQGTLAESLDVEGYARASDWAYREAPRHQGVPVEVVSELHRRALTLTWGVSPPATRDVAGAWRTTGVVVRDVPVSLPSAIHADLQAWSESTRNARTKHPIVHAAVHHAWFERIHPFVDGNGRVGRLLLNFQLVQQGYPPAVILASRRSRYLDALRSADEGKPQALAEVIGRAVRHAVSMFLIPKLAGEVKLVPLSALAAQGYYTPEYLRQLVLRGRLRAVRDGRLWLSSRVWVEEYLASRDPRGGSRGRRRPPR